MKKESDKITNSLGETLKESDLTKVSAGILESIIDEGLLEDGILKEIPILGSIIGLGKTVSSVKDYLFAKKIVGFLSGVANISQEKRNEIISKIDSDPNYKQTVGSKLLYIIDNSQDHLSSSLIAKLFVAFLNEELTYKEFCKASLILNNIDYFDLQEFLEIPDEAYGNNGTSGLGLEEVDNFFINAGLCSAETSTVTVEDQWDYKMSEKYVVEGGETIIHRTLIGAKIYEILNRT